MQAPGTNAGSSSISRLGPQFANRRPRIPRPSPPNSSNAQKSNREPFRLETVVTQTKQTTSTHSNREIEALFSSPRTSQITYRLNRRRLNCLNLRRLKGEQKSNRECERLGKKRIRDPRFMFRLKKIMSLVSFDLRRLLIAPCFD
jgi:hypothetical protein